MKFFKTKYRIVPGIDMGFMPQRKYWWWFWTDLIAYGRSRHTIADAKRVVDHYRGLVVYDSYPPPSRTYSDAEREFSDWEP